MIIKYRINRNWAVARLKMAKNAYDWSGETIAFKIVHRLINEMKETGEF